MMPLFRKRARAKWRTERVPNNDGGDAFGGSENQAGRKRRVGALCTPSPEMRAIGRYWRFLGRWLRRWRLGGWVGAWCGTERLQNRVQYVCSHPSLFACCVRFVVLKTRQLVDSRGRSEVPGDFHTCDYATRLCHARYYSSIGQGADPDACQPYPRAPGQG